MRKHVEIVGIEGNTINKSDYVDAVIKRSNAESFELSEIEGIAMNKKGQNAYSNETAYIPKNACLSWDNSTKMTKGNKVWIKLGYIKFFKQ